MSSYMKMRVGGDFNRVLDVIGRLRDLKHPNLWVRRVVTRENKHEDFIGMAKKRWPGILASEHACFDRNPTYDLGAKIGDRKLSSHAESNEQQASTFYEFDRTPWPRKYCQQPSQRLTVTAEGAVIPCCMDWNTELIVGRWPEQSLMEIWTGEKISKLRSQLKANIFAAKICEHCTSFSAYDRPEREFLKDLEGVRVR